VRYAPTGHKFNMSGSLADCCEVVHHSSASGDLDVEVEGESLRLIPSEVQGLLEVAEKLIVHSGVLEIYSSH
jgi:hypothetical protein